MTDYQPTEREQELLEYLAEGFTHEAISRRLGVYPSSVTSMVKRMLRRAGLGNATAAVHWAWQNGHLGDRAQLLEENKQLRAQVGGPCDVTALRAENESLRNQVGNLHDMYRTAVNFRDWKP